MGRESEPLTITPQGMYDLYDLYVCNSDGSKQHLQINIELVVWLAKLHQPNSRSRRTDQACKLTVFFVTFYCLHTLSVIMSLPSAHVARNCTDEFPIQLVVSHV